MTDSSDEPEYTPRSKVLPRLQNRFARSGSASMLGKVAKDAEGGGFTCPKCGRTSYHPEDLKQGYCGACHAFTGPDTSRQA